MVTGDQPATAHHIADQVGLNGSSDEKVMHGNDLKRYQDVTPGRSKKDTRSFHFCARQPQAETGPDCAASGKRINRRYDRRRRTRRACTQKSGHRDCHGEARDAGCPGGGRYGPER